ncbi:hypothetical protein EDB86DRAFT_2832008 [Lactarius hatsudake]|nr:hypothetical protein EDB86DRAFT_2832008 [Lactarius hatsudake]
MYRVYPTLYPYGRTFLEDTNQYGAIIDTVTAKGGLNNYGSLLAFSGDQIKPAFTAFAKWLSVEHDRKGAHLGAIAYSNGTASSEFTATGFDLRRRPGVTRKDKGALVIFNSGAFGSRVRHLHTWGPSA